MKEKVVNYIIKNFNDRFNIRQVSNPYLPDLCLYEKSYNEIIFDMFILEPNDEVLDKLVDWKKALTDISINHYIILPENKLDENAARGGSEKGNKYVAKDGSIKEHTGGDDSKDVMSEYTEEEYRLSAEAYKELSEQARQTRDVLKKLYGWSDKDSKSRAGSNIKGITEETADILVSYVNAIRLDVSVNRPNIQKIADAVARMPEMSGIAQSQLSQLTTLVSLAQYRNGRLDDMYSWMRSVTKEGGTKHLAV